jgi:DNA-binding beta-propeller fold protein YncE
VGDASRFAAIDTSDDSVTYLISSGDATARPHAISPTLDGDRLYIAHDTGNQVTAIDTATGSVDFTIPAIPRAEESIPSRSGDLLWVSARGDNSVKRIDLASHTVTPVPIGVSPSRSC